MTVSPSPIQIGSYAGNKQTDSFYQILSQVNGRPVTDEGRTSVLTGRGPGACVRASEKCAPVPLHSQGWGIMKDCALVLQLSFLHSYSTAQLSSMKPEHEAPGS